VGVQFQQRDFSALGEGQEYLLPTTTSSRAMFAFAEAPLGRALRLQFGARVEDVGIDGTSAADVATSLDFTPTSAAAGLVLDLDDAWRLGLALSSAARAPAQTELFARGPHDGPLTYETGDPALGMERANSVEASLRWRGGRLHADGSLWVTEFSDYIYGALTGRTCDELGNCSDGGAAALRELFYTQRDARFRGGEAHAEIELMQHTAGDLHLNVLADVVRATFDGGGNVPRMPPYHLGVGLAWQGERIDASVFVKYAGSQSDVAEGETSTAAFTTVDAQLAWRPWAGHPGTELVLAGKNLADSVQRNAVALNKDEVLLPGRDIRLMFRARFE
jgi:iron complex outermembrane receptor protein